MMRIVFIGTSEISINTAGSLLKANHEVVFIEKDKEKIDHFADEMDCGFIHGDGSNPSTLAEVGPQQTDVLFCMTDQDKDNIIAGLVGRSLGFTKTIIKIENFSYEHICAELGLEDVIVPTRTISRYLVDMISGRDASQLTNIIRGEARFFTFIAGKNEKRKIADLDLPRSAKVICYYRGDEFHLGQKNETLQQGDEVIVLTVSGQLENLKEKWPAKADKPDKGIFLP